MGIIHRKFRKMVLEKGIFFKYSEEALVQTLKVIREENVDVRESIECFGAPRATVQDKIKKAMKKGPRQMGRNPVLTRDERKIVK